METAIYVRQVRHDPKTGHITVRLQTETTNGQAKWTGMVADYGVSADLYYGLFGESIEQVCNHFVAQHKAKMGRDAKLTEELTALVGKKIG